MKINSKNSYLNKSGKSSCRIQRERQIRRRVAAVILSLLIFSGLMIMFSANKSIASDGSEAVLFKYYTTIEIQPGDTLYDLSLDYVVEGKLTSKQFIQEVVYMNNLSSEHSIITGTHIVIPYYDVYKD